LKAVGRGERKRVSLPFSSTSTVEKDGGGKGEKKGRIKAVMKKIKKGKKRSDPI